jgi:hypothetical protein
VPEETKKEPLQQPTTDAGIEAIVNSLLPVGPGRRRSLEDRRSELRQRLRQGASAESARQLADELSAQKGRELVAAISRHVELLFFVRIAMIVYAQIALKNRAMPAQLKLSHLEGESVKASFMLGAVLAMLRASSLELDRGNFRLRVESGGLEDPQADAVEAYLAARLAQGATNDRELANQLVELRRSCMLEGLVLAPICGNCDACRQLIMQLEGAGTDEEYVAALVLKSRTPCPTRPGRAPITLSFPSSSV